jgi:type 2 lantibiotic biosynthesis protein LanM
VWYQALTLRERLARARAAGAGAEAVDADLAQSRLRRWRSQPPFAQGPWFGRRLALDGLSESELLGLLGEPAGAVGRRVAGEPAWLSALREAFSLPRSGESPPAFEVPPGQVGLGVLHAVAPIIRRGRQRVREGVPALARGLADPPFDPDTAEGLLFASLPRQLLGVVNRTMVLEVNVARLEGRLDGDTPEKRFGSFVRRLEDQDAALAILQEYPVLARQVVKAVDHWVDFSLEFLGHLAADWPVVRAVLDPAGDPGLLVEVSGGAGDGHRKGRSVRIARFASGKRIVYKPRSLAVDVHFQELLAWVNERGDHPPFRTLAVVDRGDHGWVEFVEGGGCESEGQLRRFYQRQGGFLALLYALHATDFHSENLIAAGEHPVLLDLEALFHPLIRRGVTGDAILAADRTMAESVLGVGLLPYRVGANVEHEGIDHSGLGAPGGQTTPFRVPSLEKVGTDEVRVTRQRLSLPRGENRPSLGGAEVDVLDHAEDVLAGFQAVYRALVRHREELLAEDGPLARFARDDVRVILRPTQYYGTLLRESFHPDVLRDALDRDRLFDRLWVDVEHLPHLERVIGAERAELWEGDIPLFTTRPDSRDLWSASGELIAEFFEETGLGMVRHRVRGLGEEDLARQVWFIRASLATLALNTDRPRLPACPVRQPRGPATPDRLLAAARAIGDRLERLALREGDDVSWIGLELTGHGRWELAPLGADLYSGLPGVALFLAYLGAVTRERRYTALAESALGALRRQLEVLRATDWVIGAFSGWGGVIYCLTHLGALWQDPALLREAEDVVGLLPDLIDRDEHLDIISGAAGCLGVLAGLYRYAPGERTLAAAVRCGDRLLARARPMRRGLGWVALAGQKALAGFSHGAAGIAWSLLELEALTGAGRFRDAAVAALDYERMLFSPEAGNWFDLRSDPDQRKGRQADARFTTAWCHGAPGIGLARLHSLPYLDDAVTRSEIDTALRTTLAQGFGGTHSLCHGDLGNLELLLTAREVLADPKVAAHLERLTAVVQEGIEQDGWRCGLPLGVDSPGLMVGLAGIGYGLLRLAEPARVPSVLALAPPAGRKP